MSMKKLVFIAPTVGAKMQRSLFSCVRSSQLGIQIQATLCRNYSPIIEQEGSGSVSLIFFNVYLTLFSKKKIMKYM